LVTRPLQLFIMDLFIIHGIVEELKKEIVGGFITKIYQMNRTDLLIRLRRLGEEKNLILSTHPNFFRIHLTEKKYANPQNPPRFCTYLRRHITGARISDVTQDPYERVVRIGLQKKQDAGLIRDLVLVVELLAKTGNLLLVDGEKTLDCLHFRKEEEGMTRPALPGTSYSPLPRSGRLLLSEVTPERMEEIAISPAHEKGKELASQISGISSNLAREIGFLGEEKADRFWASFLYLRDRYENHSFEPRIITLPTGKKILAPFPLKSLGEVEEVTFATVNAAADFYYFETVMRRLMEERKQSLTKRIRQLLGRLERRMENLLLDKEKFDRDLVLKAEGDLLVANYSRLKKGMKQIEARDYTQDPPPTVLISLDESLDPAGNVEKYFRKYKKAKRGIEMVSERLNETQKEIDYLESALFEVEEAEDAEEFEGIRQELEEERILPVAQMPKAAKEKGEPAMPIRRFRSSDGLEIICGKSNIGNDYLLRQVARGNDLWFHAQGYPGSHALLRVGSEEPKFGSILEAATVAAFFSRGRGSTRVPVDYTPAKNVHRPRGARPGLVTYLHQKTIWVDADKEKIEKMKDG